MAVSGSLEELNHFRLLRLAEELTRRFSPEQLSMNAAESMGVRREDLADFVFEGLLPRSYLHVIERDILSRPELDSFRVARASQRLQEALSQLTPCVEALNGEIAALRGVLPALQAIPATPAPAKQPGEGSEPPATRKSKNSAKP